MKHQTARMHLRLSPKLKEDGEQAIAGLGYESPSVFIRDVLSIVAYGEEYTAKTEELPKLMSNLVRPYMNSSDAAELKDEFIRFTKTPTKDGFVWFRKLYNSDEEKFFKEIVKIDALDKDGCYYYDNPLDYLKSSFMVDYYEFTNHALSPLDLRQLVHAFYNDSGVRKDMRRHFTDIQRSDIIAAAVNKQGVSP